jgi:hypothetical protein
MSVILSTRKYWSSKCYLLLVHNIKISRPYLPGHQHALALWQCWNAVLWFYGKSSIIKIRTFAHSLLINMTFLFVDFSPILSVPNVEKGMICVGWTNWGAQSLWYFGRTAWSERFHRPELNFGDYDQNRMYIIANCMGDVKKKKNKPWIYTAGWARRPDQS